MENLALINLRALTSVSTLAINQTIEVSEEIRHMLPLSALRRGSVGVINGQVGTGVTSLLFSILGAPSSKDNWIALVGMNNLGFASAQSHGVDLRRILSVSCSPDEAPYLAAVLLDGFDIVVISAKFDFGVARKLAERAKRQKAVLLVVENDRLKSSHWPISSDFSLKTQSCTWEVDGITPVAKRTVVVQVDSSRRGSVSLQSIAGL